VQHFYVVKIQIHLEVILNVLQNLAFTSAFIKVYL